MLLGCVLMLLGCVSMLLGCVSMLFGGVHVLLQIVVRHPCKLSLAPLNHQGDVLMHGRMYFHGLWHSRVSLDVQNRGKVHRQTYSLIVPGYFESLGSYSSGFLSFEAVVLALASDCFLLPCWLCWPINGIFFGSGLCGSGFCVAQAAGY